MCGGFIKLFHKFADWEWYTDGNTMRVFLHLLISANFKDNRWKGIVIKKGQIVTSSRKLSAELDLSVGSVRKALDNLCSTNEIDINTTNKYSLITIKKYKYYQGCVSMSDTQNDTQSDTQHDTPIYKERKKERNNIESTKVDMSESDSDPCVDVEVVDSDVTKSVTDVTKSVTLQVQTTEESIDYDGIITFFNSQTNGVFGNIRAPLSDKRKRLIRARIKEHGKQMFAQAIKMAYESDFLKGQNSRGFTATFDWIILPTNFEKIISGNYGTNNNQRGNGLEQINADVRSRVAELLSIGT